MGRTATDYRELSISERIQLVEDILDRIATESADYIELFPSQVVELQRRIADLEADPSIAVPWQEVRAELFQRNN